MFAGYATWLVADYGAGPVHKSVDVSANRERTECVKSTHLHYRTH